MKRVLVLIAGVVRRFATKIARYELFFSSGSLSNFSQTQLAAARAKPGPQAKAKNERGKRAV